MNELVTRIMGQAHISEDAATQAADAVLGFLREKLPAPLVTQIESQLGGELSGATLVSGAKSMLGGFSKG